MQELGLFQLMCLEQEDQTEVEEHLRNNPLSICCNNGVRIQASSICFEKNIVSIFNDKKKLIKKIKINDLASIGYDNNVSFIQQIS